LIVALSCASLLLAAGGAGKITGSYVEVRSADVWVGACYANSEFGNFGKEGTMAWNIQDGAFNGVSLKGLSVVAAVLGNSTLGDTHTNYFPIRSVLILDSRATERQKDALRGFARAAAGKMLGTVVREDIAPITFEQTHCAVTGHEEHTGGGKHIAACTKVTAGNLVSIETRNILHSDNVCANAELFYSPMIKGVKNETPVFAPQMSFAGQGLGSTWSIPNRRGGFVADFELLSTVTENQ
jgi:hypothetical protein